MKTPTKFSGRRLRAFRYLRELSSQQLADKLSEAGGRTRTRTTIRNWERGLSQPRADDLAVLAVVLGIEIMDLYERQESDAVVAA